MEPDKECRLETTHPRFRLVVPRLGRRTNLFDHLGVSYSKKADSSQGQRFRRKWYIDYGNPVLEEGAQALADIVIGAVSWERMIGAVEKVRERLQRATAALEQAKVPYAVIGGNAVAAWVSRVDEAAARNTQDVDILLRRADLERAKAALAHAGFVYHHSAGMDMFLDGPRGKAATRSTLSSRAKKCDRSISSPLPTSRQARQQRAFGFSIWPRSCR